MKDKGLVILLLSTLFIKDLWTLHPDALLNNDAIQYHKLFPYSDVPISWPMYIYFASLHAIQLVLIRVHWMKFPDYRPVFTVWFWIQACMFVEYFMTYNESKLWFDFQIGGVTHRLKIGFTLLRNTALPAMLIFEDSWNKTMPRS